MTPQLLGDLSKYITKLEQLAPNRIRIPKSLLSQAALLRRYLFGIIVYHLGYSMDLVNGCKEGAEPSDLLLRVWKQTAFVFRKIGEAKGSLGEGYKSMVQDWIGRLDFLNSLNPATFIDEEEEERKLRDLQKERDVMMEATLNAPSNPNAHKSKWSKVKVLANVVRSSVRLKPSKKTPKNLF